MMIANKVKKYALYIFVSYIIIEITFIIECAYVYVCTIYSYLIPKGITNGTYVVLMQVSLCLFIGIMIALYDFKKFPTQKLVGNKVLKHSIFIAIMNVLVILAILIIYIFAFDKLISHEMPRQLNNVLISIVDNKSIEYILIDYFTKRIFDISVASFMALIFVTYNIIKIILRINLNIFRFVNQE